MIKASIDSAQVTKMFNKLTDLSKDLRPVLLQILGQPADKNLNTIRGSINAAFVTQGGSTAFGSWKPLSRAYQERKNKKYPGKTILVASGRLYQSLVSAGSNDTVQILTTRSLSYGTVVPYAGYHQSTKSRVRIPRRPYMDITQNQLTQWKLLITNYLEQVGAK